VEFDFKALEDAVITCILTVLAVEWGTGSPLRHRQLLGPPRIAVWGFDIDSLYDIDSCWVLPESR
jgi:hypothetical protein